MSSVDVISTSSEVGIGLAIQSNLGRTKTAPLGSFLIDQDSGMYIHINEGGAMHFTVSTQTSVESIGVRVISSDGNEVSKRLLSITNTYKHNRDINNLFEFDLLVHTTSQSSKCCFFFPLISWKHNATKQVSNQSETTFEKCFLTGPMFVTISKHSESMKSRQQFKNRVSYVSTAYFPQGVGNVVSTSEFLEHVMRPIYLKKFQSFEYFHESELTWRNRLNSAMHAINAVYKPDTAVGMDTTVTVTQCATPLTTLHKKTNKYLDNISGVKCLCGSQDMSYDRRTKRRNGQLG
jgi:hypothetical protein